MTNGNTGDVALSILVHAPFGKDGKLITEVLAKAGIGARCCPTLQDLYRGIEHSPGAVLVADEALTESAIREFTSFWGAQPPWSDLPLLVLTSGGDPDDTSSYRIRILDRLRNVTLLERPLRKVTLVSAVRTALRSRCRQYEIRDYIDQRSASEEALRASEERWRFLANALPQFIWTSRPGSARAEFINQYWYEYTGLSQTRAGAASWSQVVHPDDLAELDRLWTEETAAGREISFEYRVRRARDSTWRWHLGILKPERNATGETDRWVGVGIDIHDRRETEAALRRANAALEQFAYAAAHDLQEPVRNVSLFAQLLATSYHGTLDERGAEYLRMTIDCANQMQRLIKDLLAYTRVVDDSDSDARRCDAEAVLALVLRNLHTAIEDTGTEVTHDPLPEVGVVHAHLTQLLQNLISNAIKYRSEQPPRLHVTAKPNKSGWLFSVDDNGQGIPAEHRQRVFQVFKRLHGRDVPGTGIGLAICERVVTHYGGRIWVESKREPGTRIAFIVPAVNGASHAS